MNVAPTTFPELLEGARRRETEISAAVEAFRALPFDDQLRFLVTIEGDVAKQLGDGAGPLQLAAGAGTPMPPPAPPAPSTSSPRPAARPTKAAPPAPAPRRKGTYGPEVAQRAVALYDQGLSITAIATKMGISHPTISKMVHAAGRQVSRAPRRARPARDADPEDSSRRRAQDERRERASREVAASGPAPKPRLLRPTEELANAQALEALEVGDWELVLETPALRDHPDVSAIIAEVLETTELDWKSQRAKARAGGKPTTEDLRAGDGDRAQLDRIVTIARRMPSKAPENPRAADPPARVLDPEIRDRLVSHAAEAHAIRHRLVTHNLGLVGTVARKYLWSGHPYEDLMQEGTLGLMRSIGSFDYRRGLRFSTFSMWWIRHHVGRFVQNRALVRIPVHIQELGSKIHTVSRELESALGRPPTDDELAKAASVTKKQLHNSRGRGIWLMGEAQSLDAELPSGKSVSETFADPNSEQESALDRLIAEEGITRIRAALELLTGPDADILRRRYGIDCEPQMLEEIGRDYDLSRERIRQLEKRGKQRMRAILAGLTKQRLADVMPAGWTLES